METQAPHPDDLNPHGDVHDAPANIITQETKPDSDPARKMIAEIDTPEIRKRLTEYFQQK